MEQLTLNQLRSIVTMFNVDKLDVNNEQKSNSMQRRLVSFGLKEFKGLEETILEATQLLTKREKEIKAKKIVEGKSEYSPCYLIENKYQEPTELVINKNYHLKWAYRAARFKLKSFNLETGEGVVYTGKTNKKLLKIKLSDLLLTRRG